MATSVTDDVKAAEATGATAPAGPTEATALADAAARRGSADVWERWLPVWHTIFGVGLGAATVVGLTSGELTGQRLAVALGGCALLVAGYVALFVRQAPWATGQRVALAYILAVGLVWAVLLRQSTGYFWMQAILFSQAFFLLPIRWAAVAVAWLVAIAIQFQVERSGGPIGDQIGNIIGTVVTTGFFVLFAAWIGRIIDQSAERRELIARLEAAQAELAERERQAGVHEERERMSRELHDTLAQDLVSIVAHLQAADAARDAEVAARHRAEATRMAHEGIADTRRVVWALRPAALETSGLPEALDQTVDRWREATGTRANLTITGTRRPLHPDVEVTLLRTAQEALANAARHASAGEVSLTLSYLGDVVTLDVHDDGVGFDPARPVPAQGGGLGLVGMRERAERLGGHLAVESAPGEGTTLGVTLPAVSPT